MEKLYKKRFWEIDSLRGIAIIMMIVFHLLYDLNYFGGYGFTVFSGFWWLFARITATIFIFLVGISLTISHSRAKKLKTKRELHIKYLVRGLKIFSWGLIITIVTWVFLREGFIIFGILHFIGIAIILAHFLLKSRYWNLLLGITIILIGIYLQTIIFDFPWLIWLGFAPQYLYTIDYFPLLPWFGVALIGMFFGGLLYPSGSRRFKITNLSNSLFIKPLCFLGRHSLFIYLIHQPILIMFLYLFVL